MTGRGPYGHALSLVLHAIVGLSVDATQQSGIIDLGNMLISLSLKNTTQ